MLVFFGHVTGGVSKMSNERSIEHKSQTPCVTTASGVWGGLHLSTMATGSVAVTATPKVPMSSHFLPVISQDSVMV